MLPMDLLVIKRRERNTWTDRHCDYIPLRPLFKEKRVSKNRGEHRVVLEVPSHLAMGKTGVWNHLKNVGLPTQEKKKKASSELRQPFSIFELHQSADKLTKPSEIPTTHQRLSPQSTAFAKLQGSCGHVQQVQRLCTDVTWTFPPCTARRASFLRLAWQGAYFVDGVWQSVSTISFLFLASVGAGVSQDCLLKTTGYFVPSFF